MHEFDLIRTYLAPLAGDGALGLVDDAAILTPPQGQQLVITTDTLHEAVHFKAGTPAARIAQKALRVNVSDLAAMGAKPLGYTLNLSLPAHIDASFIGHFCSGLEADQNAFNITLLGGDTTRTHGPLSITVTAFGTTKKPLQRAGAHVGDNIYVSGAIGAGYLGLHDHSPEAIAHYERPQPQLALGQTLAGIATACMDISDGLVQDLGHLCAASHVGAQIEVGSIPLADPTYDTLCQITGGDDYQLLFTAAADAAMPEGVTAIGKITQESSVQWRDETGNLLEITRGGWQHF